MGCFDATCAVSRTAIGAGDPVLAIWTDEDWLRDTHSVESALYSQKRHAESMAEFDVSIEELRAKLPAELRLKLPTHDPGTPKVHWAWGICNDYGTIEKNERADQPLCMVHRTVAGQLMRLGGYEGFDGVSTDPLERFLGACYAARIQIGGNELLGVQHCDAAEMWRVIRTGRVVRRWQWRKFRQVLAREARDGIADLWWSLMYSAKRLLKRSSS